MMENSHREDVTCGKILKVTQIYGGWEVQTSATKRKILSQTFQHIIIIITSSQHIYNFKYKFKFLKAKRETLLQNWKQIYISENI